MKPVSLKMLLTLLQLSLFLLMGAILFASGLGHTRDFLQRQLQNHAQDAATALSLRLAPAFRENDMALVSSTVDAVYDGGYFKSIILTKPGGETLLIRDEPMRVEGVPSWFMKLLPLDSPEGTAEITTGWRHAADIHVLSHPGYAYIQLWQNAKSTLLWTLLFCLAGTLIMVWLLNKALHPLTEMEQLALHVGEGRFPRLTRPTRIREFNLIGQALNHMSESVERMLQDKTRMIDRLLDNLHHDPATGLANRTYFLAALEAALNEDASSCGIILLQLGGLEQLNIRGGRETGDRLLVGVAAAVANIAKHHGALAARLDGTQFGFLLEPCTEENMARLSEALARGVDTLLAEQDGAHACSVHAGAAHADGHDPSSLLARADGALRDACLGPSGSVRIMTVAQRGRQDIRHLLLEAIRQETLELAWQPVLRCGDHGLEHDEAFARLPDGKGQSMSAGAFISLAEEEGLIVALDRIILTRVMETLDSGTRNADAVNVSAATLASSGFVNWLSQLAARPDQLYLECSLGRAAVDPDTLAALAELKAHGFRIALDRFVPTADALEQMAALHPDWIKIESGLCRHASANPGTGVLLAGVCEYAHELGVKVAATGVECEADVALLCTLGIDAIQGRISDRHAVEPDNRTTN